jgi:signal transduction histidine kinase
MVGRIIQTGESKIEHDITKNNDYIAILPDTQSQLVVPIKNDEGVTIGAISVESADVSAFDERDKDAIEMLARQANVAVTKDKQRRVYSNAKAIALVGAAGTIWEHRTKSLARSIKAEVERLEGLGEEAIGSGVWAAYLRSVWNMAEDIRRSPSTAPLSAEEGVADRLLNPMIETRIGNFNDDRRVDVFIDSDLSESFGLSVSVSEDWFGHALDLILENAIRGVGQAGERRVLVRTEMRDPGHCVITVTNAGPRVADEVWEKLGNELITEGESVTGRLGIGILLADMILGVYGGKWQKLANEENKITVGIVMPVSGQERAEGEEQ